MINLSQILKNRENVLGRNERQLYYIRRHNLRKAIKIADDKILSKKILKQNYIAVPEKIASIRSRRQLETLDFDTLPNSFVIKPVKGTRGAGVEIFYNRDKQGRWIRADGSRANESDLKVLIQDILDGKYSLFNQPDTALLEERVKPHKAFKQYTYKGTPDIRIIVYNKIPIMSYIRLPTKQSNGKANLDLGAIGAGIDIAVGKTTHSIVGKSTPIEYIPDTNIPISGLKIPYWEKILKSAVEASKATKLGFAAIDFLIDRDKGPLIVELNARPGLSMQLSNGDGMRWRLVKAIGIKVKTTEQGVRIGKDLFGGEIEEEIEEISGKKVIGLIVNTTFFSLDGKNKEVLKAKVDTGADLSSMDLNLAARLGYEEVIKDFTEIEKPEILPEESESLKIAEGIFDELKDKYEYLTAIKYIRSSHGASLRLYVKAKIMIDNSEIDTNFTLYDRTNLSYQILLGKNTLQNYLIDPSKK